MNKQYVGKFTYKSSKNVQVYKYNNLNMLLSNYIPDDVTGQLGAACIVEYSI